MSGKILARASAISLALILAACGGDENSTSIGGVDDQQTDNGDGTTDDGGQTQQEPVLQLGTGSGDSFQDGAISLTATELSSGGSTRLDFNVVDTNNGYEIFGGEETTVSLSSLCGPETFSSPVITTTSGRITTSYEARCSGQDTITARLDNGETASATLTVAPQEIGSLEFVSVTPQTIAISGSSDSTRGNVSTVIFKVLDEAGNPVTDPEVEVDFTLSTSLGGVALTEPSSRLNESGEASTRVTSGSVATVVSVTATATVGDKTVETTSDPISISASIPDHDSFSISVEGNFLPNARNYDGVETNIRIRAADRNNNLINDTIVNFITSAGAIQNECILQAGACTATWVSQDPRNPNGGVVAILARSIGEESFEDVDGNGEFDAGTDDRFDPDIHDTSEAFLDKNNNGIRDNDETRFDYNGNGSYDVADGIYNGQACTRESADADQCTNEVKEIFETAHIFAASDNIAITLSTTPPLSAPGTICIEIAGEFRDIDGNLVQGPPPGGTSVEFSTDNGEITGDSSFDTTTRYTTSPVQECIRMASDGTPSSGTLTVKVTPPAPSPDRPYIEYYTITD